MNLRRGWWILGIVAACALLAAWPAVASEGYFSNADGELTSSDLVTYTAAGHGGPADPSPRTAGYCDTGVIGYMEYLHMGAHRDGMDVAQIANFVWPNTNASVLEAQYGRDSGFRVGFGYQFANCWDATWNYMYFSTDGTTDVSTTAADTNSVLPTQLPFLGALGGTDVGDFQFRSLLICHVNDLEFGRSIRLDDSASLRLFGGFRWAIIDQSLAQAYQNVPAPFGPGLLSGTSIVAANMDGYGIRLGTEGRMNLPSGFSLFGKTAISVLAGHFDYSMSEVDGLSLFGGPPLLINALAFNESTTQVVPVLEAAVGVGWTYNQLELSLGYELNAWFNMANRYSLVDVTPVSNNLLLDGFFVRAAFTR